MDVMSRYLNAQLRAATSRCIGQIGFTHANTECVDVLTDVMKLYLKQIASHMHDFTELSGRTMPTLIDVELVFKKMRISVPELYQFMRQVRSMDPYIARPIQPILYDKPKNKIQSNIEKSKEKSCTDIHDMGNQETSLSMTPLPNFLEATASSLLWQVAKSSSHSSLSNNVKESTRPRERSKDSATSSSSLQSLSSAVEDADNSTSIQSIRKETKKRWTAARSRSQTPKKSRISSSSGSLADTVDKSAEQLCISHTSNDIEDNISATNLSKCQEESKTTTNDGSQANIRKVPILRIRNLHDGTCSVKVENERLVINIKKSIARARLEAYNSGSRMTTPPARTTQESTEKTSVEKRKQERTRCRKPTPFPYLVSDLIRNSYIVLSACMTGRAFPMVKSVENANESTTSTHHETLTTSDIVDEIIWRHLAQRNPLP
ncbi:hypothetical protein KIN20_034649 [Parelaphostrongylus tenuis]|uniref:Bromodomain associated domain-containing protein n=1 Tax=Parelaphostrongylus tenuis TaxID=148309 RepID=A0AAD5RCW7_PARTN|nr:hypothetical protein KIN20_034649 [Parelaphostrongylus tenuis]